MTWDVQGVDEKSGEAVIRQKFDRVQDEDDDAAGGRIRIRLEVGRGAGGPRRR